MIFDKVGLAILDPAGIEGDTRAWLGCPCVGWGGLVGVQSGAGSRMWPNGAAGTSTWEKWWVGRERRRQ